MTANLPRKLTFEPNVWATIALQYPSGRIVQSRIPGAPNQAYYVLTDGRCMYLPLEAGAQIDALKLKIGEPFRLMKINTRTWKVERIEQPKAEFVPPLPDSRPVNGAGEDCAAILARCYSQAIGIAVAAVEAAREAGLMVSPSFEDLRCISSTLLISEVRR